MMTRHHIGRRFTVRLMFTVGTSVALLLLVSASLRAHSDWCGYDFSAIVVPDPRGSVGETVLQGLNDDRLILGGFAGASRGYLLRGGLFNTVITVPGSVYTIPAGINDKGEIVGEAAIRLPSGALQSVGFYRDTRGRYTTFTVPNARLTAATDISTNGLIVGTYSNAAGDQHGFLLRYGSFETIDAPFGSNFRTGLTGINRSGTIIGSWADDLGIQIVSFVFADGVFTPVTVPDKAATYVSDINDRGQIVGYYVEPDNPAVHGSFVKTGEDFTLITAPFPGTQLTELAGINNRGEVVGRVYGAGGNIGVTAVPRDCSISSSGSLAPNDRRHGNTFGER